MPATRAIAVVLLAAPLCAWAGGPDRSPSGVWRGVEAREAQRERVRELRELERDLNGIRARELRAVNRPDLLSQGYESVVQRLDGFGDDALSLPLLFGVFERAPEEVRLPIVSMLFDRASHAADAELARWAIDDASEVVRAEAERLLWTRVWADRVSDPVRRTLADALLGSDHDRANRAAEVIETLELYEAVPAMVNAQVVQRAASGAERSQGGAQAWILVGTQRTYVQDVTPIVGTGSVAFDPTVGVLTDGSLLVVRDAVVTIYRHNVHSALVRMTSQASGEDTSLLGYNVGEWQRWLATSGREPVETAIATMGPGATRNTQMVARRPDEQHTAPAGVRVEDEFPPMPAGEPILLPGRWDAPLTFPERSEERPRIIFVGC